MSFEFDEEEFERDVKIKVVGVGGVRLFDCGGVFRVYEVSPF